MKFTQKWKNFWQIQKHTTGGFTLVELIVVIAILAILAGIAVPAYNGYIAKANEAADQQLLAAINTAFAAACIDNGTDVYAIDDAKIALAGEDGNRTVDLDSVAPYKDAFAQFYAGSEDSAFKVFDAIYFSPSLHAFVEMDENLAALMETLRNNYGAQIGAFNDSLFADLGYKSLAGNIDLAAAMMAGIAENPTSGFYTLLNGEGNMTTLAGYMSQEKIDFLFQQKVDQLNNDPAYADKTDDEKQAIAANYILANTAVLTAAQNTTAINDDFISALANGSAVPALKNSTDGGSATSDTVAQAAFAYAMYTSYKASIGEDTTASVNINDVYDTLETTEFQNYMANNSAKDRAGYLAAMELISVGANDADNSIVNDVLLNGFSSEELLALMQGVTTD